MLQITDEYFQCHQDVVELLWRDDRPRMMIYEVYEEEPAFEMEAAVLELTKDDPAFEEAVFYRVDLNRLTPAGATNLACYNEAERYWDGIPEGTWYKIPFLKSFIWGVGYIDQISEIEKIPYFISELRRAGRFPDGGWKDPNR